MAGGTPERRRSGRRTDASGSIRLWFVQLPRSEQPTAVRVERNPHSRLAWLMQRYRRLEEDTMIARSPPFTLRNVLDRAGLASPQRRNGFTRRTPTARWQRIATAFADWSAVASLAWPNKPLLRDRPERFRRFCRECVDETPHQGFDELGAGWYAQICRCQCCGEQTIRVWLLGWW